MFLLAPNQASRHLHSVQYCTSHDGLKHQFPCVPPGEYIQTTTLLFQCTS